jgi:hypothetical protein
MRQQNNQFHVRDTTLLTGWLFADLLLGLMMIFLVAVPPTVPPPVVPPVLIVDPLSLDPTSHCTGDISNPQCTVTVGETASSHGQISWKASSDMSNTVSFSPASGTLSPGKSVPVTITAIPCQNGSFTFSGSRGAVPVTISWRCSLPPERLDFNYIEFTLTVHDINGLLSSSQAAINDIKQQVKSQSFLKRRDVGLAIVYGGAPDDAGIPQAQQIATKVYSILGMLGQENFAFQRASYYVPLFDLGVNANTVKVDIYLFIS